MDAGDTSPDLAIVRGEASRDYALDGANDEADALALRVLRPTGEFNHARVVARRGSVEHWLNGVHLATLYVDAAGWAARATGAAALEDPELSRLPLARVQLRDRGSAVWFRNLKIRELHGAARPEVVQPSAQPEPVDFSKGVWVPHVPNNAPLPMRREGDVWIAEPWPQGYVRTRELFHDFVLELDWRFEPLTSVVGDGGILLRIAGDEFWPRSLEVDLNYQRAGDLFRWAGFTAHVDPGRSNAYVTQKLRDTENQPGEWNHAEIRLEQRTLTVLVNGEVVNTATEVDDVPGAIGLKFEGGPLQYRNARITRLD